MKLQHLAVMAIGVMTTLAVSAPAQAVTFADYSAVGGAPNMSFTGAGAGGTLSASAQTDFSFLNLGAGYTDLLATYTFSGTSTVAPMTGANYDFQTALNGSFSFIYNGAATDTLTKGENLLSGTFTGATISGPNGGSTASVQDAIISGGTVGFTSSVMNFPSTGDKAFSLALTSVTAPLLIRRNGTLNDFSAVSTGSFASDLSGGGGSGGVPEPASWALMLIGFAGVGIARRSSLAAQRKALA